MNTASDISGKEFSVAGALESGIGSPPVLKDASPDDMAVTLPFVISSRRLVVSKSHGDGSAAKADRHSSFEVHGHERSPRLAPVFLLTAAIAVGSLGALFYFLVDPVHFSIFPPCLFHQLTGLYCPGCGGQRSFHQLLHGHLIAAIRLNAMFVFSLPLLGWLGARYVRHSFRGQPASFDSKWWWAYVGAWILFAVLRNLPFPICQWFAA